MDIVATFRKSLTAHLEPQGLVVSLWSSGTRKSNHLLEVATTPRQTVLYVKGSSNNPGFWGLTKNQLDALSAAPVRWFCVFLHKSSSIGYLLSGGQVQLHIKDGSLRLAGDGDFKVNERAEFVASQRFNNISDLASRIF